MSTKVPACRLTTNGDLCIGVKVNSVLRGDATFISRNSCSSHILRFTKYKAPDTPEAS